MSTLLLASTDIRDEIHAELDRTGVALRFDLDDPDIAEYVEDFVYGHGFDFGWQTHDGDHFPYFRRLGGRTIFEAYLDLEPSALRALLHTLKTLPAAVAA